MRSSPLILSTLTSSYQLRIFIFPSDFDDEETSTSERQPSGLAATEVLSQTPAAANLLAGTSSNPLDDLVSIFGGSGGGFGAAPAAPVTAAAQDPLAGLAGLSISSGGAMSPMTPGQPQQQQQPTPSQQSQGQQEDLLGLF